MPRLCLVLWMLAPIAGCRPIALDGEPIGEFRVVGTLEETTCGDGHPAPASFTFYVELRSEPDSPYGYWKVANQPLVGGALDDGVFRFEHRAEVVGVEPDPAAGVVGCTVERSEVVSGTLGVESAADAGVTDAGAAADESDGFAGRTVISITPMPGGNCTPLLLPYGGAFPALPCEIRYSLDGAPQP